MYSKKEIVEFLWRQQGIQHYNLHTFLGKIKMKEEEYKDIVKNYESLTDEFIFHMAYVLGFTVKPFVSSSGKEGYSLSVRDLSDEEKEEWSITRKESRAKQLRVSEELESITNQILEIEKATLNLTKHYAIGFIKEVIDWYKKDFDNHYGKTPKYVQFIFDYHDNEQDDFFDYDEDIEPSTLYLKEVQFFDENYQRMKVDFRVFYNRGYCAFNYALTGHLAQFFTEDTQVSLETKQMPYTTLLRAVGKEKIEL